MHVHHTYTLWTQTELSKYFSGHGSQVNPKKKNNNVNVFHASIYRCSIAAEDNILTQCTADDVMTVIFKFLLNQSSL